MIKKHKRFLWFLFPKSKQVRYKVVKYETSGITLEQAVCMWNKKKRG